MTPASYSEKAPKFTAAQWDGTDEAAEWISGLYNKAERDGEGLYFVDAMDRRREITPGTWVVRNELSGAVYQYDDEEFQRRFEAA